MRGSSSYALSSAQLTAAETVPALPFSVTFSVTEAGKRLIASASLVPWGTVTSGTAAAPVTRLTGV